MLSLLGNQKNEILSKKSKDLPHHEILENKYRRKKRKYQHYY